jgi:hypothetical protein
MKQSPPNKSGGNVGDLSPHEIEQLQGTRLSDKPQWESYQDEMETKLSPELEEQVKRYQERVHERNRVAEEELARQKELSDAASEQYRWVTKEEYEEIEPRIGHIMHSTVFLGKLKKLGLPVWYAEHPLKGRYKLVLEKGQGTFEPSSIAWVQSGFMPEYSIMRFDEHDVPLDERMRGWRTILMQILLKRLLTEEQIISEFGRATGPASEKYNNFCYEIRNMRLKLKEE